MARKPRVIALEEHYWDAEVATHFDGAEARSPKLRASTLAAPCEVESC